MRGDPKSLPHAFAGGKTRGAPRMAVTEAAPMARPHEPIGANSAPPNAPVGVVELPWAL